MGDRLRRLIEAIIQNPKVVTPADLNRVAEGLGFEVVKTKEGFMVKAPNRFVFNYPKPHPGRTIKPAYVKKFIKLAGLEEVVDEE